MTCPNRIFHSRQQSVLCSKTLVCPAGTKRRKISSLKLHITTTLRSAKLLKIKIFQMFERELRQVLSRRRPFVRCTYHKACVASRWAAIKSSVGLFSQGCGVARPARRGVPRVAPSVDANDDERSKSLARRILTISESFTLYHITFSPSCVVTCHVKPSGARTGYLT